MEQLKAKTDALDRHVQQLNVNTEANTAALVEVKAAVQRDRERNDRDRKWTISALLAGLLLILAIGSVAFIAESTARELNDQRTELWCPVFARAVGNYNPPADPGPTATEAERADYMKKRDLYEENYGLIKNGFYNVLRCPNPPIRTTPTTR